MGVLLVLFPQVLCAGGRHVSIKDTDVQVAVEDRSLIDEHTGLQVGWEREPTGSGNATRWPDQALVHPLSAESAVAVALVTSPDFQATLEELGIARGALRQAGLLANPVFSARGGPPNIRRKPDSAVELGDGNELSVTQNVLDFLLRPLRRKMAEEEYEEARLRVGDAAVKLAANVKTAFWTLVGAQELQAMQQLVVEAAEAATELSKRQREAGNISELELENQNATYQQSLIEQMRIQVDVSLARETLGNLLGLTSRRENWKVQSDLPQLPRADPSREAMEILGLAQRLDLAAARRGIRVVERNLELTRASTLKEVNVGIFTEQDPDGFHVTGPSVSVNLPLFDRQQGKKMELKARIRQTRHQVETLEIMVRADVRMALQRLGLARQLAGVYQQKLIPLQARVVELTQQQYNFMLIGVYQLLIARQNEVMARRDGLKARVDYWVAWASLEKAVGRHLIPPPATPSGSTASENHTEKSQGGSAHHVHEMHMH